VQTRDDVVEVLCHLSDADTVDSRSTVVVGDALERASQVHLIRN